MLGHILGFLFSVGLIVFFYDSYLKPMFRDFFRRK